MVIEVPEELKILGEAMVEVMAAVQKARAGTAGNAVDYRAIEVAIGDATARIERAGHQVVLQSLDVDRPSVMIGGARFVKVGRSEATYYTLAGPIVVERSLYWTTPPRKGAGSPSAAATWRPPARASSRRG